MLLYINSQISNFTWCLLTAIKTSINNIFIGYFYLDFVGYFHIDFTRDYRSKLIWLKYMDRDHDYLNRIKDRPVSCIVESQIISVNCKQADKKHEATSYMSIQLSILLWFPVYLSLLTFSQPGMELNYWHFYVLFIHG